jgi:hypothetical protein
VVVAEVAPLLAELILELAAVMVATTMAAVQADILGMAVMVLPDVLERQALAAEVVVADIMAVVTDMVAVVA